MKKIAVFASGTGSNFEAIHASIESKDLDASIGLVVVDNQQAQVIEKARTRNIPTFVFNPKEYGSKEEYERKIIEQCIEFEVEWIVLAGYMRVLSSCLLDAFENKIVNIHPSLLPAFKGKDAIGQAIDAGAQIMGVTVHFVNAELDGGAIIAQQSFPVKIGSTRDEIENEIHRIEHRLYPKALQQLWEDK